MIGLDGIGFHAIGEMITNAPPAITYGLPSKATGISEANYFQKGVAEQTAQPTVVTT